MKIQHTFDFFKENLINILKNIFRDHLKLRALRRSHYFDAKWYLENYKDVLSAGFDPARHYLEFGAEEGRDPGPMFSTSEYLSSNPDIKELDINPLLHYERFYSETSKNNSDKTRLDFTDADRTAVLKHIGTFPRSPFISVVMPVFDTSAALLSDAIESILQQCYQNWELCIADDASQKSETIKTLKEYAARDPRIKIVYRELNGNISVATNSALEIANGEFVAFFDHDDLLHETALYEVALEINKHPDANIIYSDEDTIDESGKRSIAHNKTSFNPELFLGQNMINHLGVYRRSLIEKIGGFRVGFEGSQDYDLALRAWAEGSIEQIHHIPAILYHWRRAAAKKSFSEAHLAKCIAAARAAIQDYLDLEGEGAKVTEAPYNKFHSRIMRQVPIPQPLVTVIIPTKDRADLLSVCVDGILNKTDYSNIEILIVDHESKSPETLELFKKLDFDRRIRIIPFSGQFNYSAINNMAARKAKGSILALLNNDIEVLEPNWLSEMVSHAVRPEVGAVGAKLLYPNGRVQHAGVVLGYEGSAGHSFHYAKKNAPCYFGYALLTRAVSAVTGACLVVRKEVFLEVGGLNEKNLAVAFNDVDLCLKIQTKGYRNVWTPFAKLIHHESLTRGYEDTREKKARVKLEIKYLQQTWHDLIADDPFYNPNLTLKNHNFDHVRHSRRTKPWAAFLKIYD
jgi:glycosyltransferase involved in cell wall biosynthesis